MSNEEAVNPPEPEIATPEPQAEPEAPVAAPPTKKVETLNALAIIFGFIGIFIAGFLSYAKMQNLLVPCTEGVKGCATVDASEMSMLFGKVYVGFLGLGGYILLTGLAIARGFLAGKDWSLYTKIGLGMSCIGTVYSFFLTFYSISILDATCIWCICSALTMASICLVNYLLLANDVPQRPGRKPLLPAAVGFVLAAGLFGGFANSLRTTLEGTLLRIDLGDVKLDSVLPADNKFMGGGRNAPVVLIEFADFNCPACRGSYDAVHKAVEAAGPKLGYGFRNFPIFNQPGHETSQDAALIAEYAADKGKYFDWINAAFDPKNNANMKTNSGLTIIAEQAGLDAGEVQSVLGGTHEKFQEYFESMSRDMDTARSIGSMSTPTFVVIAEGSDPVAVPHNKLAELFSIEPYRSLLQ